MQLGPAVIDLYYAHAFNSSSNRTQSSCTLWQDAEIHFVAEGFAGWIDMLGVARRYRLFPSTSCTLLRSSWRTPFANPVWRHIMNMNHHETSWNIKPKFGPGASNRGVAHTSCRCAILSILSTITYNHHYDSKHDHSDHSDHSVRWVLVLLVPISDCQSSPGNKQRKQTTVKRPSRWIATAFGCLVLQI